MSGPLTLGMDRPRDLLEKARRERERLQRALLAQDKVAAGDALLDFAVTGFHIKDWIKNSGTSPSAAAQVENYVKGTPVLEGCRDVCNSGKHFELTDPSPDVVGVATSAVRSVIVGERGVDPAGIAEPSQAPLGIKHEAVAEPWRLKVIFSDSSRVEALEFADQVIEAWERFFASHGL